jgi:hypothetical protein
VTNETLFYKWEVALKDAGISLQDLIHAMGHESPYDVDWTQFTVDDLSGDIRDTVDEVFEGLEFSAEDLERELQQLPQMINELPLILPVYGIEDTLPGHIFLPAVDLFEADYDQFVEDYNAMVAGGEVQEVQPATSMVLFQSWVFQQLSRLYVMFWRVSELFYDKDLDFERILRGRQIAHQDAHTERYEDLFTPTDDDKE